MTLLSALCRLSAAFWVGGSALFTFVLTPLIFRNEPRDSAARIVGYLFPGYFRWGILCGLVALVCRLGFARRIDASVILLVLMIGVASFQAFGIEPRAAELKSRIVSFENTPKDHPLRREFSRLHAVSAVCNIAVIAGGVAVVILL